MLEIRNVVKIYTTKNANVTALGGVSLAFRESEFVSVLGPSGCGKTTLLNVLGGLDRYTSGEISVNGKSTADFSETDWDDYRNKRIGFVFQSYNLIAHQTVIENVELALALSGEKAVAAREKAVAALEEVGLGGRLYNRPSELSGGEMQRVAIARALVNQPDIVLADEPTGALDSKTGVQIMELLKKIAEKRLVIMVTHNDKLAADYSTRIIRFADGKAVSDSNPYYPEKEKQKAGYKSINGAYDPKKAKKAAKEKASQAEKERIEEEKNKKRSAMSFKVALGLSFKNLATKKARTLLTTVACSIGIIGLALVLALYNGLNVFLVKVQSDALSAYPMSVTASETDYDAYISIVTDGANYISDPNKKNGIFVSHLTTELNKTKIKNKITADYVSYVKAAPQNLVREINFDYGVKLNVFKKRAVYKVDSERTITVSYPQVQAGGYFKQLVGDKDFMLSQYDLVAGKYPEEKDELCLILDKNNRISDAMLVAFLIDLNAADKDENGYKVNEYSYEDFLPKTDENGKVTESTYGTFTLALNNGYYVKGSGDSYYKKQTRTLEEQMKAPVTEGGDGQAAIAPAVIKKLTEAGITLPDCYCGSKKEGRVLDLKITGILRLNENTTTGAMSFYPIGYTQKLAEYVHEQAGSSNVVKAQKAELEKLTGGATECLNVTSESGEKITGEAAGEKLLKNLGWTELPNSIYFYASSFENKIQLKKYLAEYNNKAGVSDEDKIYVSDLVGTVIDVLRTFINTITAILLSLTAISLVVAAIMIAVITYVSVMERTREIGVLRAIGARKRDVTRVFNAETIIIGAFSGIVGVLMAIILNFPMNAALHSLTGVKSLAVLSPVHALILIAVSVLVTFLSGAIPALSASRRDPVKALRSE